MTDIPQDIITASSIVENAFAWAYISDLADWLADAIHAGTGTPSGRPHLDMRDDVIVVSMGAITTPLTLKFTEDAHVLYGIIIGDGDDAVERILPQDMINAVPHGARDENGRYGFDVPEFIRGLNDHYRE